MRIRCILTILVAFLFVLPVMAEKNQVEPQNNATEKNAAQPQGDQSGNKLLETNQRTTATGDSAEEDPNAADASPLAGQKSADDDFHGILSQPDDDGNVKTQGEISNEPDGQSPDEDGAGMNWLSTLLALVAMGISGYVLYSLKGNKKRRPKPAGLTGNDLRPETRNVLQQIQRISLTLNTLEQRVEALEQKVNSLPVNIQAGGQQPQQQSWGGGSASQTVSRTSITRYTSMVTSDGFPDGNLMDANGDYAIAILSLTGDTGTFVVNNLPSAQPFLISNFAYSVGRICEV